MSRILRTAPRFSYGFDRLLWGRDVIPRVVTVRLAMSLAQSLSITITPHVSSSYQGERSSQIKYVSLNLVSHLTKKLVLAHSYFYLALLYSVGLQVWNSSKC